MTKINIINIDYLKENCINDDIYELCSDNEQKAQRLINIVENKIKMFVDIEQFKQDNGDYKFPEDLKATTRFLVESLFILQSTNSNHIQGQFSGYTEKFDDYMIKKEFKQTQESIMFYDIPIISEYLDILNFYRGENKINLSGRIAV